MKFLCSICIFFVKDNNILPFDGSCRRFPPTLIKTDEPPYISSVFPQVKDGDGCGEFRLKGNA